MLNILTRLARYGQISAMILFGATGLFGLTTAAMSFAGYLPWLDFNISFDGIPVPWAGMALQTGLTALIVSIALFLPSAWRVQRLELSHRRFEINMDDITKAYRAAHMADRNEVFGMRREFDAVRERFQYLQTQVTLADMDADLITIAAQMSEQSRGLAETFSDANVSRAKESLKQRQSDAEALQARINQAGVSARDLRRRIESVEYEEGSITAQLLQLRDEVTELVLNENESSNSSRKSPNLATV